MSFVVEFSIDICYIPENDNTVADALSRTVLSAVQQTSLDFSELANTPMRN